MSATGTHRARLAEWISLGYGIALAIQLAALYGGIVAFTHLPWLLAVPLALVVGTAVLLVWPPLATVIGLACAVMVWHIGIIPALIVFFPQAVIGLVAGGTFAGAYGGGAYRRGQALRERIRRAWH